MWIKADFGIEPTHACVQSHTQNETDTHTHANECLKAYKNTHIYTNVHTNAHFHSHTPKHTHTPTNVTLVLLSTQSQRPLDNALFISSMRECSSTLWLGWWSSKSQSLAQHLQTVWLKLPVTWMVLVLCHVSSVTRYHIIVIKYNFEQFRNHGHFLVSNNLGLY